MTHTCYIFRSLIQIQGSRLSGLLNVAEQLARLSGVCERSETGVRKHQDGRHNSETSALDLMSRRMAFCFGVQCFLTWVHCNYSLREDSRCHAVTEGIKGNLSVRY